MRGLPFIIYRVEFMNLDDVTDEHLNKIGLSRDEWIARWDECNPKHQVDTNPAIMLLWLELGWV